MICLRVFDKRKNLRKSFALKIVMSCSGYFLKKLTLVQLRAVGAYWCERKCLRSGEKINNEIWTDCRLPEQTSFGTCKSGYNVVVSTNNEVSTLTEKKTLQNHFVTYAIRQVYPD